MDELLTLVYTSQQNTSQHIPYPGTTKPCEWHIWHLRKLFRESTGIYNYYTIKQVSTHTDFCPICLLAVMSDATTASTWQLNSQLLVHLWVASVHFSLLWVTPLPTPPITGLWHHFYSLCICLFLSVLWWTKNLKLKPVLGQSLNNVDINQSKQESNLQTSSVLMRVLHSSLHMFSVRSWNRLVYGRCCCLKDPTVAAKQKYPKWNR